MHPSNLDYSLKHTISAIMGTKLGHIIGKHTLEPCNEKLTQSHFRKLIKSLSGNLSGLYNGKLIKATIGKFTKNHIGKLTMSLSRNSQRAMSDSFVELQKPSKLKAKSTQIRLHMAIHLNHFLPLKETLVGHLGNPSAKDQSKRAKEPSQSESWVIATLIWHKYNPCRDDNSIPYIGLSIYSLLTFKLSELSDKEDVNKQLKDKSRWTLEIRIKTKVMKSFLYKIPSSLSMIGMDASHNMPLFSELNPGIRRPDIEATQFELKPVMFQMLQMVGQFSGMPMEDPHLHLQLFMEVSDSFKIAGVTEDTLRLKLFPYLLRD
ncbi:Imidazoleglycerol-phosphate dehydratase [Gossypium australe]|uniref:Imidazoleglycerol-phosphate dehydratase n=1 Tax=Gossypium australe TaxID=47621 RepID=A0A5B6VXB3_9ROSI|nr:Imidazoleglycerol-phosphate dehydratase [Gossypium australe]